MPVKIQRTQFADFEALNGMVQDRQSEVVQLDAGPMEGRITHLSFGPQLGVSTGRFSQGIRVRGMLSERRWGVTMMLEAKGLASVQGSQINAGDVAIIPPGHERYTRFTGHTRYSSTFIHPDRLQRALAPHPGAQDYLDRHHHIAALVATPATAKNNVLQLRMLLGALAENGTVMTGYTSDFYERNIVELLTKPIHDAAHYHGALVMSAERVVRDVDEYLMSAGPRPVHISELCEHFNIHPRALFRAFHDVLGIAPITYLRRRRLSDVHTALRRDGAGLTVKDVAMAHGFIELGRFAYAYRRMFGEKPSHTLRRTLLRLLALSLLYKLTVVLDWLPLV